MTRWRGYAAGQEQFDGVAVSVFEGWDEGAGEERGVEGGGGGTDPGEGLVPIGAFGALVAAERAGRG